jgi:CRISPR-associated endonuclease Cas2
MNKSGEKINVRTRRMYNMLWVVAYDVPATHDKWRLKVAKLLSNFGLFRIQYSVFSGVICQNVAQSCKIAVENLLRSNQVPADVRFFPLCLSCEGKVLGVNNMDYIAGKKKPGLISSTITN